LIDDLSIAAVSDCHCRFQRAARGCCTGVSSGVRFIRCPAWILWGLVAA